jgi:hypothetical protein
MHALEAISGAKHTIPGVSVDPRREALKVACLASERFADTQVAALDRLARRTRETIQRSKHLR